MTSAQDRSGRAASPRRPVGRGEKVRAAVLAATLAAVTEHGFAALTVEEVARRSGVHKTTVYRRWPNRESLVTDAVLDMASRSLDLPAETTPETDLRTYARGLATWLTGATGQAVLAVLTSDAARLPRIAEARRRFFAERIRAAEPWVRAAVDRGSLPAGTDPGELVRALVAPIYLRLLVTAEPVDEAVADSAAATALAAARAGLLGRRPSPPT